MANPISSQSLTPKNRQLTVTLLVPTLNEVEGMKAIMPLIDRQWVDQVLVLDGGSTDGTLEYAQSQGYDIALQERPGLINGFRQVFKDIKNDVVITFSPDGNSLAEVVPDLVREMERGYDMVIASRYLGPAKSEDDTWFSGIGNWVFTALINTLFGGKYTDAMVMYRAYKMSIVYDLGLMQDRPFALENKLRHKTGLGLEPLLSMRAAKQKLKLSEVPGDEPARLGGVKKCRHFLYGSMYLLQMVQETFFWRLKTNPKPAHLSNSLKGRSGGQNHSKLSNEDPARVSPQFSERA